MATYFVNIAVRDLAGNLGGGLGTFNTFTIDGRFGFQRALDVARETVSRRYPQGQDYEGFYMAKGERLDCLDNAKLFM